MADSNKGEELRGMKYQEDTVRSRRKYIEYRMSEVRANILQNDGEGFRMFQAMEGSDHSQIVCVQVKTFLT